MIPEVDELLETGSATVKYQGKEIELDAEKMPLLIELHLVLKSIGMKAHPIAPLLVKAEYNNGKACSMQNLSQLYKRGRDPQRIVGQEGLYEVIELFLGLLKLAIKKGEFNKEHPVQGKAATEFVRQAIVNALA